MPGTGDAGDGSTLNLQITHDGSFPSAESSTKHQQRPAPQAQKYPELENLYEVHKTIGSGGFSKVKMATELCSGEKVAIKIVDKDHVGAELPRIALEIKTLQPLCHPHICKLKKVIYSTKTIFMIMEYCPTDLYEYIVKQDNCLSEEESRGIFTQLMSAVAYLHANGIAHRDLKPENVLLDYHHNVKLTDFGLCAVPRKNGINKPILRTMCGSPAYCAPELLKGPPYIGSKADVWSLGVILFVLMAGQLPFYSKNLRDLYRKIQEGKYSTPEWITECAKDIIGQMLQPNVSLRPSLNRLWSHPWILSGQLDQFQEQINQNQNHGETETKEKNKNPAEIEIRINENGHGFGDNKHKKAIAVNRNVVQFIDENQSQMSKTSGSGGTNSHTAFTSASDISDEAEDGMKTTMEHYVFAQKKSKSNGQKISPALRWIQRSLLTAKINVFKFISCISAKAGRQKRQSGSDESDPQQVYLETLLANNSTKKSKQSQSGGLTIVDEQFADCILDKLQHNLQSMGIPSQRKGSSVKHGVTSPIKFKFEVLFVTSPCNMFCLRRNYISSQDPTLIVKIMQEVLLISAA